MMNRRKFLALAAAIPLTAVGTYAVLRTPARATDFSSPLFIPGDGGPFGVLTPQGKLALVAERGTFPLAGGKTTPFLWYRTQHQGKTYQNPILNVRTGAQLSVTLDNALDEGTILHWHGLHLPGKMDGNPRDTIGPGAQYRYDFTVNNRSGTYWYHTHAHNFTAKQAYFGLASFFIVEDDDEVALREALDLQLGVTDLPVVIQDKRLNQAGEFIYSPNPMEKMMGFLTMSSATTADCSTSPTRPAKCSWPRANGWISCSMPASCRRGTRFTCAAWHSIRSKAAA